MGIQHERDFDDGTKIFKLTHAVGQLSKMATKKFSEKDKSSVSGKSARSQKFMHDLKHGNQEDIYFNGRLCKITVNERVFQEVDGQTSVKVIKKPHPIYEKFDAVNS